MKYNYITIEREYGSGGTEISKKLSKACDIPCYGREILEMVSQKTGIPVSQIEKYEEKPTNSFIYSVYMMGMQAVNTDAGTNVPLRESGVYVVEQNIIRNLSQNGPAIFLGRCACEVLKERNDVLHVFIHADKNYRIKRSIQTYSLDENDAEGVVKQFDKKRSNYYQNNTGKKWNDVNNYDVVLDSGKLGIEACVTALKSIFDSKL